MKKISQLDYLLLPSTLIRLLLWLLSLVLVLASIGIWVINSQRITFDIDSNDAMYNINEQLLINDAALAGFGSILASVGPNNLDPARNFTKHMRDTYPHIYMFEALISIDPGNKTKHEVQMRGLGYPGYKVTRYVSKKNPSGKSVNLVNGVPMHFPIFFIDPYLESVKGLMGFDMMSARNMREPLLSSLVSGDPAASQPYKLREGGRGYSLIKVLDTTAEMTALGYLNGGLAVMLIIKTDTMLAPVADILPGATVQLLYGEERQLAADEILPQVTYLPLFETDIFLKERSLDHLGQPFTLSIQQPAGLYAHHLQFMGVVLLAMCIAFGAYYRRLNEEYGLKLQRDDALVELNQQHATLERMVAERTKELQKKSNENTSLAQQLIRVQEDQILHIARELHDEFGQTLTAIKINAHILESAKSINEVATYAQDITSQADALYETMRDMIQRLRPEALDMFGLKVAVEQCILAFHLDEQDIELDLNIDDSVNGMEEIYTIASYRIVQELVNNAVKHAKRITKLEVHLAVYEQHMAISVKDNGIGFDQQKNKWGFGLSGVDERARSLGGTLDVSTSVNKGVKVSVRIPLLTS